MPIQRGNDAHGFWTYDPDCVMYTRWIRAYTVCSGRLYKAIDVYMDDDGSTSHRDDERQRDVTVWEGRLQSERQNSPRVRLRRRWTSGKFSPKSIFPYSHIPLFVIDPGSHIRLGRHQARVLGVGPRLLVLQLVGGIREAQRLLALDTEANNRVCRRPALHQRSVGGLRHQRVSELAPDLAPHKRPRLGKMNSA